MNFTPKTQSQLEKNAVCKRALMVAKLSDSAIFFLQILTELGKVHFTKVFFPKIRIHSPWAIIIGYWLITGSLNV